MSCTYIHNDMS